MSDVRGKNNPFAGPLGSKPHRVPNSYGARRDFNNVTSPQTPPAKQPVIDKYKQKHSKPKNLETYKNSRDKYKQTRRIATDKPYRPSRLAGIEEGTTPVVTHQPAQITDEMRIRFLDNIIANADKLGTSSKVRATASGQSVTHKKSRPTQFESSKVDPRAQRSYGNPVKSS